MHSRAATLSATAATQSGILLFSSGQQRKLCGAAEACRQLGAMPDAEAAGLLYWVMQALVEIQPKNLPSHEAPHSFSTLLEKMLAALLGAAVANEHAALAEGLQYLCP